MRKKDQLTVTSGSSNFSFSCGLDRMTLAKVYEIQDLLVEHGARRPSMSLMSREALQLLYTVLLKASRENDQATISKHVASISVLRRTGLGKSIASASLSTTKEMV